MNALFTGAYLCELVIKLTACKKSGGFGKIRRYLESSWFNMYDSVIVLISMTDVVIYFSILSSKDDNIINGMPITILRATRIIRLFKLARYWKKFRVFNMTIWRTLSKLTSIGAVLLIIVFTYTLLGLEFFGNKARINPATNLVDFEEGITPMFNFDHFLSAFFTVFIILTNDG